MPAQVVAVAVGATVIVFIILIVVVVVAFALYRFVPLSSKLSANRAAFRPSSSPHRS